jgi:hypothetical protein
MGLHRAQRLSLSIRTTATHGINDRVNEILGITVELENMSQVTNFIKQILSFLASGGCSAVKTQIQTYFHMQQLVRYKVPEKPKLAQNAYEEVHRVGWVEDRVLEIKSNSRYRKHKESTCLTNSVSPHSLDPPYLQ